MKLNKLIFAISIAFIISSCSEYQEKKELIVVGYNNYNTYKVTSDDDRVKNIWEQGSSFIANESTRNLILESVSYSTFSSLGYTPTEIIINQNSVYPTNKYIHYKFVEPPSSITVSQYNTSTTRWFLHYQ